MDAYNGSAVVAMAGKGCVGIASDTRLGVNQFGTVSANFQKIFKMNTHTFVGLAGLATDVQTVHKELVFRSNLYQLREEVPEMPPAIMSNVVASMLYGRRFAPCFVSPVVAGLDPATHEPFLSAFDYIGAACYAKDFVCNGTSAEQLVGVCEALWKPDMNEEELMETLSQSLLAAVDRDCVAGWGAVVHVMTPTKITTRQLKCRMD
ncbi:proteasome beta subunit [Besnoitia besnoiti]|uniref:Proteasome beta subunit n=1 Tax=Besnoitia besnoiti TaxID=94643 RepID=A0A2A9MDJ4_BESBE|nr:proteasome beta subunit [Besnoitia besnoiti]PFH34351.1 proteasome beta subunit [Besnoitia besnoiti]